MKSIFFICVALFSTLFFAPLALAVNNTSNDSVELNKQLENMSVLLKEAKVKRVVNVETGEVTGFKFEKTNKGQGESSLDLKVGDVVKSVNGQHITNPNKAMILFNQMKTNKDVNVKIDRDGEEYDSSIED